MFKKYLYLLFALTLVVSACKKEAEKKTVSEEKSKDESKKDNSKEEDEPQGLSGWEIVAQESVGKITPKMSYTDLEEAFGKENLKKHEFCIEGNCQPATKVLEEGKDMVSVVWADKAQKRVDFIEILSRRIKLPNGVHIGTTLSSLERKNGGKAIKFSGFGWDFSGNIQDYSGGALSKISKDFNLALGIEETNKKGEKTIYEGIGGDITLVSTNPKIAKLPIFVDRIKIFFEQKKKK